MRIFSISPAKARLTAGLEVFVLDRTCEDFVLARKRIRRVEAGNVLAIPKQHARTASKTTLRVHVLQQAINIAMAGLSDCVSNGYTEPKGSGTHSSTT